MPILRNRKHEVVAQEMAVGKNAIEASAAARFPTTTKTHKDNARKRAHRKDIKARVLELRQQANAKGVTAVVVTIEKLIDEADDARLKAMDEKGGAAAANACIVTKAKLAGLWVDKKALTDPTGVTALAPIVIEVVRFSDVPAPSTAAP